MNEFGDEDRKVDEVTGDVIFTGQILWSRFLQAMKNANMQTKAHITSTQAQAQAHVHADMNLMSSALSGSLIPLVHADDEEDDSEDDRSPEEDGGMLYTLVNAQL